MEHLRHVLYEPSKHKKLPIFALLYHYSFGDFMKQLLVGSAIAASFLFAACGNQTGDTPQPPAELPELPSIDSSAIKDSLMKAQAALQAAADSAAKAAEAAASQGKKVVKKATDAIQKTTDGSAASTTVRPQRVEKEEGAATNAPVRKSR
jgi:hypothetical protein